MTKAKPKLYAIIDENKHFVSGTIFTSLAKAKEYLNVLYDVIPSGHRVMEMIEVE